MKTEVTAENMQNKSRQRHKTRSMKTLHAPHVVLLVTLLALLTGCTTSTLDMAVEKHLHPGIYTEAPTVASRKAVLELPLVCFTLLDDYGRVGTPDFLVIKNEATAEEILVYPLQRNYAGRWKGRNLVRLIMVHLPAGQYSLVRIQHAELKWPVDISSPVKWCFTVKDSQVSFLGRLNLHAAAEKATFLRSERVGWTLDCTATMAEDEQLAKELYVGLKAMPCGQVPFYTKPPTSGTPGT